MQAFTFNTTPSIVFEAGSAKRFGAIAGKRLGPTVLFVTDPGLRKTFQQLKTQAPNGLKGLILDLRNNPGGLLDQAIQVSDDLIDQGEIVSTRGRRPEDAQRSNARAGDITNGLPVVVLINGDAGDAAAIEGARLRREAAS